MKLYTVKITSDVKQKLATSLERYTPRRRIETLMEVDRLINNLSAFPLLGERHDFIEGKEIRKLYSKPFNVFYSININHRQVVIYAISHYREYYKPSTY